MDRVKHVTPRPGHLFLSIKSRHKPLSKNALSFLIRSVIAGSGAISSTDAGARSSGAHSVRSVSTSFQFWKNFSTEKIVEAASWRGNSVFVSHYLRDISLQYGDVRSLGPIVAAGDLLP